MPPKEGGLNVDNAAPPDDPVVSKGKFAELTGVTPGRVSQWIAEGKIGPDALVGEGRNAKINVRLACEQLKRRLNVDQRFGANGLGTRLDPFAPQPSPPVAAQTAPAPTAASLPPAAPALTLAASLPPPPVPRASDDIDDRIKLNRLEQLERANRKDAEDEAARTGRFTETDAARQQYGRIAAQMLGVFEGALSDFATVISAAFKIPQRDVLHGLRAEFRNVRARAAAVYRQAAGEAAPLIEIDIADRPAPVEDAAA